MRIGIDFRILTVGPTAATRGMPRYTQQQLREVLALGGDDEYVLFCDPRTDRSLILPEIRGAPNVRVVLIPEAATVDVHEDAGMLAKAEIFESWLATQELDIYHATTPFYLDQLMMAGHDACPYVATVYDLIPLIYPSQYLATPKLRQLYLLATAMVRRATRLIAISEAARRDASWYLGFPEDRIDVASPIAEPFFRPMAGHDVDVALAALRARLGLAGSFVLSVADLHFTKNLETLLRGYALLPARVRDGLPLVVACHLSAAHEAYLGKLAAGLGVGGQVITTGLVSDRELASLYNAARFVVHPSRFEGFGLPVLEAMQSGTPVIATTSSSVPEVAGGAAVLVDPDDAPAFAEAMAMLDADDDRREEMRARGLTRASEYTGNALANATRAGYARAAAFTEAPARPRLAVWAPLPPLQSGVADYSAELASALAPDYEVEFFVDDGYLPALELLTRQPVRHHRAFERLAARYDAVLYQFGGSSFHRYMEGPMRRHPGVVVLHDLVRSDVVHHRHPRLGDIVSASLAQIVHFPAAVDELVGGYPGAQPAFVPMGVRGLGHGRPELRATQARSRLCIAPSTFVIGVFGMVADVECIESSVVALAEVMTTYPDALLLVVGPVLDPEYGERVVNLAGRLGVGGAIQLTGYLASGEFDAHLVASDVVVDLRRRSKKQMSATVLRAAAAGKPVILTDLPEWDFLPDTFCWRVAAGKPAALAGHLLEMAGNPELRASLGASALAYHRAEASMSAMAAGYADVLERIPGRRRDHSAPASSVDEPIPARRSTPKVNLNKVCEIEDFADPTLAAVLSDVFSYKLPHLPPSYPRGSEYRKDWEIAMAVRALREGGALRPDAVILGVGVGSKDTSFYLTRHVERVVATDRYLSAGAWTDMAPEAMLVDPVGVAPYEFDQSRLLVQHMDSRRLCFPDDAFDGIFSSGSIEHLGGLEDIAAAAYEMGRVLKVGGVLSVSTEILLSGPPGGKGMPGTVLFSPDDLRRYIIEASGLELVDDLRLEVSQSTMAVQRDLTRAISDRSERGAQAGPDSAWPGDPGLDLPHLVGVSDGYVFGSVHLAMRKGEYYPATPNAWARPSTALVGAIEAEARRTILGTTDEFSITAVPSPSGPGTVLDPVAAPASWDEGVQLGRRMHAGAATRQNVAADASGRCTGLHAQVDAIVSTVQSEEALAADLLISIDHVLGAVATMPTALDELAHDARFRGRSQGGRDVHRAGWRWCPITLPNGVSFGVMVDPASSDELTGAVLAGGGPIDWTTVMLMLDKVRPGDLVVDLGACLGTFTLAAAASGCRVVAVEGAPLNAALLRASVVRNGFTDVHVINAAVGDAPGLVTFCADGPFGYVESSIEVPGDVEGLVVHGVTVDALLEELALGPVRIVKMDVEGSEIRAVRGMTSVLSSEVPPVVLFESNGYTLDFYGSRPADLLAELENLGFAIYLIDPMSLHPVPAGQIQLQTVVDYLAVKGPLESSYAWGIGGSLSIDERIARMVRECERSSPYADGQRAYVARALARAEPEVLAHPDVVALLAGLRGDPGERVRLAAAWSGA